MANRLLGLDIGTSGVKTAVFTMDGRECVSAQQDVELDTSSEGWAELSPDALWEAVIKTVRAVVQETPTDHRLVGIGLSTSCPGVVACDQSGQCLRPIITFLDTRAGEQINRIGNTVGTEDFFRHTGNRLSQSTCSAATMLWIRDHEPEIWRRTFIMGHLNTLIGHRLTGAFGIDPTNAAYTGLYAVSSHGTDWDEELVSALGMSKERLPDILPSAGRLGSLTRDAASALDLPTGIPVAVGAADTACSSLAVGLENHGQVFESAGTSGVLTVCVDKPTFDPRFLNRPHVIPDRWLLHGAMSASGASFRWLRHVLVPSENVKQFTYTSMERMAGSSPPGAGGVVFLPYMLGERTPLWDANSRGTFVGLSLSTTRADLVRSVMEGAAFGLRQILTIVQNDLSIPVSNVLSVGGAARSSVWTQIKADVTRKPFLRTQFPETAALGAALLGGVAGDHLPNLADGVPHKVSAVEDETVPDPTKADLYDGLQEIYDRLHPSLKPVFDDLADFRRSQR